MTILYFYNLIELILFYVKKEWLKVRLSKERIEKREQEKNIKNPAAIEETVNNNTYSQYEQIDIDYNIKKLS